MDKFLRFKGDSSIPGPPQSSDFMLNFGDNGMAIWGPQNPLAPIVEVWAGQADLRYQLSCVDTTLATAQGLADAIADAVAASPGGSIVDVNFNAALGGILD